MKSAYIDKLIVLIAFTLFSVPFASLRAGEFNRVLSIGDPLPSWTDLEGVDGAKHSTADFSESKVLVIAFTCNSCPYAVDIEERLIKLDGRYAPSEVQVVAINVNTGEADSLEAMKERAAAKGFAFEYLFDPTQKIARDFGATRTPEFFVFNDDRKLVYQGSLDDSPDGTSVGNQYVISAVQALLDAGDIQVTETVPIGCNIRYERTRRSRSTE